MPDAMKAAREHVKEEPADELVDGQCHRLAAGTAFDPVILPGERSAAVVGADQPAVRNRDPMRVAGQVGQNGLRSGKRPLGIDEPPGLAQRSQPILCMMRLKKVGECSLSD
jgi:hypothetical protein